MRIYVASSWRNEVQPDVVSTLRDVGHEVYDFRDPFGRVGDYGFHWSEIDPAWKTWSPDRFREALDHPIARAGFTVDFGAMAWSDLCVLVSPCGRNAHLEAGCFVGAGKPLHILLADQEPELMYRMATALHLSIAELVGTLGQGANTHDEVVCTAITAEICRDILGLVDVSIAEEECASWTEEQRKRAHAWAGAVYDVANDNDGVVVPQKPSHVPQTDTEIRLSR